MLFNATNCFTAPTGMVQNLRGETNFTSISIYWQPLNCLLQNGQITQYSIMYTEVGINRLVESVSQVNDVY